MQSILIDSLIMVNCLYSLINKSNDYLLPFFNALFSSQIIQILVYPIIIFSLAFEIAQKSIPFVVQKIIHKRIIVHDATARIIGGISVFFIGGFSMIFLGYIYFVFNVFAVSSFVAFCFVLAYTALVFFVAMEIHIETNNTSNAVDNKLRKIFDHSLQNFLPIALIVLLIVPITDYLLNITTIRFYPIFNYLTYFTIIITIYVVGDFIGKHFFTKLEIDKNVGNIHTVFNYLLPLVISESLFTWDRLVSAKWLTNNATDFEIIMLVLISGILPLRLVNIFRPKITKFQRIASIFAVVLYIIEKTRGIHAISIA